MKKTLIVSITGTAEIMGNFEVSLQTEEPSAEFPAGVEQGGRELAHGEVMIKAGNSVVQWIERSIPPVGVGLEKDADDDAITQAVEYAADLFADL